MSSPLNSSICRCCLRNNDNLNSLYSNYKLLSEFDKEQIQNATIKDMLVACTQITIEKEDGLPQFLCITCTKKAAKAYSFRCQTRHSDEVLRNSEQDKISETFIEKRNYQSLELVESKAKLIDKVTKSFKKKCKTKLKRNKNIKSNHYNDEIQHILKDSNLCDIKSQIIDDSYVQKNDDIVLKCNPENLCENECDETKKIPKSDTESILSKADNKDIYFENEIIESIATFNDADSNSFINKYAKDIEDTYFSNNYQRENSSHCIENGNLQDNNWSNEISSEGKNKKENKSKKPTYPPKKDKDVLYEFPNEPQVCSVCNHKCLNINALIKHRNDNHAPKKFQCLTCGNGLTTARGLRLHMRLHTGEKPEVCNTCGKAFADPRTLKSHIRIHTGQQPFPCTICNKGFSTRLSLSLHLRSHTGERPYKCPQCDKSYVQANSLQIHIRTHTGARPYACKLCDKAFTNGTSLSVHMLTHSGVKNFQCTICGKRMARSGELTIHLRTHSGERPFICAICHKSFTNSSGLRVHMPTHTGIKNFVCTVCGKRLARAVELKNHMRTHTGERHHKCPQCGQKFSTSYNMKLHQRKHTGEKPFVCEVCDRRFADSHVLRNHIRTHTGERPYTCETCGHTFAQQTSLRTHLNAHHKATKVEVLGTGKKSWTSTKGNQSFTNINSINAKQTEFINNIDESSLSKILSSAVIDRNVNTISLQECLPIDMQNSGNNEGVAIVDTYNHSLANTIPIMNVESRDETNYISNCTTTTIS